VTETAPAGTPPGSSEYTMYEDEQAETGLAEVTHDARDNRMHAI